MSFFDRFFESFGSSQAGFVFMWILVFIALASLFLIITRHFFLTKSSNLNASLFTNRIKGLLIENKPEEAVKLCDAAGRRALPWIIKGAILNAQADPRSVRTIIEERTVSVIPRLEKNLLYLATLGNISTMVGLMGTIYGLILSFAAVGAPDIEPAMKSSMLADGISAAMNTTLFGLVISIPSILFYTFFRSKVDSIIADIDQYIIAIIRQLAPEEEVNKSYKPSERKTKEAIDTDPNITPIMGLMVVLIPLLLSSAEFVKIGRATINLPQASALSEGSDEEPKEPPKTLSLGIVITEKGISLLHTLGDDSKKSKKKKKKKKADEKKKKEPDIPVLDDKTQDYATLTKKLIQVKKEVLAEMIGENKSGSFNAIYKKYIKKSKKMEIYHYKDCYNIKLLADNRIKYQTIISIMDAARMFKNKQGNKIPLFPVVSIGVMTK